MDPLSPYALGSLDELLAHLRRRDKATEEDRDRAVAAGNRAVGWMERRTGRRLRARTHRTAVTVTGTWTTAARTVTGSGFTATVKVYDDIVASGLRTGTRVDAVAATQLTISETPTAGQTSVSVAVGSEPLVVDGDGTSLILIPEEPAYEVYAVNVRENDGTATALDLTGARIEKGDGFAGWTRYVIPADATPAGVANIEIECAAGFRPPSETARGDWSHWENLKGIWLRVAEVYFQEKNEVMGRKTSRRMGQSDWSVTDPEMPSDVTDALESYARKP